MKYAYGPSPYFPSRRAYSHLSVLNAVLPCGAFWPGKRRRRRSEVSQYLDRAAIGGSRLTDAEADAMAEEMKADWWARNEHRFIPPGTEK